MVAGRAQPASRRADGVNMSSRTILVTGGAGYIGSHMSVALLERGHDVVIVDNLSNSSEDAVDVIARLGGRAPAFHEIDLLDREALAAVFDGHPIDAVIHFAGLKAVGESVDMPLAYYRNNLLSTLNLMDEMAAHEVFELVFSSSATVYGDPEILPIPETAKTGATNPYGRTKLMIEEICRDAAVADERWRISLLRYFNPVGAHPSGDLGEDPQGIPNNLVPYVMQVAVGRRDKVGVFGDDYDTPDGTGVRDYIHVVDLAEGHVAALARLLDHPGSLTVNLGTGVGHSVLDVVKAYAAASGRPVPYRVVPRRPGDVAACYADPSLAATLLGWRARLGLDRMCADSWRWQSMNPQGFEPA